MQESTKLLTSLGVAGAVIGIGQLLSGGERLTLRLALGRAIVSGGLGMCAGASAIIFPELSFPATVGMAAVLSSLGTSAIERLFQRVVGPR